MSSLGCMRSVRSWPLESAFSAVSEETTHLVRDKHSNLIKSAALFFCLGPCCLFVQVCFLSRMFLMENGGNKRSSNSSFLLLLPSKEIISACEMTSRKATWNCLFFPTSYQPATMSLSRLPGRQNGFRHFATHRADNGAMLF